MQAVHRQFAVALTHPDRTTTSVAINTRTEALPAWFLPVDDIEHRERNPITREKIAQKLGEFVTDGDSGLSVSYNHTTRLGQILYVLPANDDVLKPGYAWQPYGYNAVDELRAEQLAKTNTRRHKALSRVWRQAFHLQMLMTSLGTEAEQRHAESYFNENPGMYELEELPRL